jgi:hypothetical protein
MLREPKGAAAQVLAGSGISADQARAAVLRVLQDGVPSAPGEAPAPPLVPHDVTPIEAISARAELSLTGPYTARARRALATASVEAARLGADEIATEHILLGLLSDRDGVAAVILERLGFDAERARATFDFAPVDMRAASLPLGDGARRALRFARTDGGEDASPRVGTDALLLGLLREGEGLGWQLLWQLLAAGGVTLHAARSERDRLTG